MTGRHRASGRGAHGRGRHGSFRRGTPVLWITGCLLVTALVVVVTVRGRSTSEDKACAGHETIRVTAAPGIASALRNAGADWASTARPDGVCAVVQVTARPSSEVVDRFGRPGVDLPDVWLADSSQWVQQLRRETSGETNPVHSSWVLPSIAARRWSSRHHRMLRVRSRGRPPLGGPACSRDGRASRCRTPTTAPRASSPWRRPRLPWAGASGPPSRALVTSLVTLSTRARDSSLRTWPAPARAQLSARPASRRSSRPTPGPAPIGSGPSTRAARGRRSTSRSSSSCRRPSPPYDATPSAHSCRRSTRRPRRSACGQPGCETRRGAPSRPQPASTGSHATPRSGRCRSWVTSRSPTRVASGRLRNAGTGRSSWSTCPGRCWRWAATRCVPRPRRPRPPSATCPMTRSWGCGPSPPNLEGGTPWRQLVSVGPLGSPSDRQARRQTLRSEADRLPALAQRRGDTGLYRTTWDAFETVRHDYDPRRYNSVVVVTDGTNTLSGLTRSDLLSRLKPPGPRRGRCPSSPWPSVPTPTRTR